MTKIIRRSGFKNHSNTFWMNDRGARGCRYQCKHCGKVTLGISSDVTCMHFTNCRMRAPQVRRRYHVAGLVTISVSTVVEASSEQEARELALRDRVPQSFCHQCASADTEECWATSGELDGAVEVVEVRPED